MANLLYLVHRMPYPPDKGDKVRSYHLLRHLVARHRVFVATFVDDPADAAHLPTLRALCADVCALPLNGASARVASLAGLLDGQPLTLHYYRDAGLRRWLDALVRRERIDAAVVFSSSMAPYAEALGLPTLLDFVDLDSAKWSEYAQRHPWPMSWLYRREGERLLAYERAAALRARRSFFVTEKEVALFVAAAPECAGVVEAVGNGVDAAYFAPDAARVSPFAAGELPLVFTGAMDYWPNIDAVDWFARDVLPALRRRFPAARFHIVGRNPSAAVRALAGDAVSVSGTVPDIRPYLQHAAVVVAPLRLARGIQNKVLEAMAMGRPVVTTGSCASAIDARAGSDLLVGTTAAELAAAVDGLLADGARAAQVGAAGRACVLQRYSWDARLSAVDRHLAAVIASPAVARPDAVRLAEPA